MSSPSKDASRSVYHEAFPDDSLVPSPSSSSSTSSSSSSSNSNSNKGKVTRGPPKWNPFERYPEFLERDKWLKEENQLLSEEEEDEFQRFVHGYEKYKAKDKAGEPFWEEQRRSLPSFSLDAARDERYFIGYDEEGNEVRYNDEKHLLKRVRQSEILKFQADCRKVMKQREECRKRREEEKIRKRDVKENQGKDMRATRKYDISFVGKKQGLWRKSGFKEMNEEIKKEVTRDGESQYVAVNKAQEGRKKAGRRQEKDTSSEEESNATENPKTQSQKMAEKNNKRRICMDEVDNDLQTAAKKMNAVSYDFEKNADSDFGEDNILLQILTRDKPGHSGERRNMGDTRDDDEAQQFRGGEEFAFDGKFSSDDEEEEPEFEKRRSKNKRRNRNSNKDDEADGFEYKVTEEDYIIPGFEQEAEFSGDDIGNGSDIDHLAEILERTENASPTPLHDTMKTKETYETDDVETEEMHAYETKAGDKKKINPQKSEETEEEDSMGEDEENEEEDSKMEGGVETKTAILFRHSSRFQKELEEKQMKEVRQKVLNDLADMDVAIELLMMDLEGRDASDNEEAESETERNVEEEQNLDR
ncbi:ABC transporter F family member 4-like [Eriocheir sinensis]|uniref:ABC transporter F family member 4-like n=1 Tax=Eriocheir sinensis TaxID=95602 RepID=UPI0021C98786|nr:ABC transporter F family member 4-like [Eriocheir sinensis]